MKKIHTKYKLLNSSDVIENGIIDSVIMTIMFWLCLYIILGNYALLNVNYILFGMLNVPFFIFSEFVFFIMTFIIVGIANKEALNRRKF